MSDSTMDCPGPNGEEPNVTARPLWSRGWCLTIRSYIAPGTSHVMHWHPDQVTHLVGFQLEGPPKLVIRELWIGVEQVLGEPLELGTLDPPGFLALPVGCEPIVCPFERVVLKFGSATHYRGPPL